MLNLPLTLLDGVLRIKRLSDPSCSDTRRGPPEASPRRGRRREGAGV
jgi:hypothetical protein